MKTIIALLACVLFASMASADDDPQQVIPARLKLMFETADKPLELTPVVAVQADWAIVGWRQDGRGGRALLKKTHHGWSIYLCSGDSLKDAGTLQKIGLSANDAAARWLRNCAMPRRTSIPPRLHCSQASRARS
jgi:hypothetical protein